MINIKITLGIVLLFLVSSCATTYEFPIEVMQSAKVDLPSGIKNITLVSRNLKYSNDTLQNYYSKNYNLTKDFRPENYESFAIIACFDSLSNKKKKQKNIQKITFKPISFPPKK